MGFPAKGFLLLQLAVLLVSCFTVFGQDFQPSPSPSEHHDHGHYHDHTPHPSHPHVHPQAPSPAPHHHGRHHHDHPPAHPPAHTPAHPPFHIPIPIPHPPKYPPVPRSFVAVQGVVYCKPCKYAGVDTLLGATPVLGATVKLECYNTKYPLVQTAKTDKNGYFFITAPKSITSFGAHKCKASLVSSPDAKCNIPTNLHYGLDGSYLRPEKPFVSHDKLPFFLYTVGPFAFAPKCPR
ncbi:Pistil-specific extensin-like protein [Morella rubra]|uniref:Pistil-specific extensin-like protein n=1 Tax=Morella rubra TaxID=262757 RepID=A0A6A1W9K6_9ROSI|nr:Pistil-specific extensin-like protein [Morella rubra]